MLVRLEAKGVLRHEMDGARYIYSATTARRQLDLPPDDN
jgi:predicted transcriptional regulator